MPSGLGLLAGLAEGVKNGLLTYTNMKNVQHQQKMQEISSGVMTDPETGELKYTPEKQAAVDQTNLMNKYKTEEESYKSNMRKAGTPETSGLLSAARGAYNALPLAPGQTRPPAEQIFTDQLTGDQAEKLLPYLKGEQSGGYAGQLTQLKGDIGNQLQGIKNEFTEKLTDKKIKASGEENDKKITAHDLDTDKKIAAALDQIKAKGEAKKASGETPAQKAIDTTFGKDYAEYAAGGGYAGVKKNLDSARGALALMESGQVKTGGIKGLIPDSMMEYADPKMAAARQALEQSVQASLRQTLGAQFTEREGTQILARTFNKKLPTAENVRRAKAVIGELEARAQAKQAAAQWFEEHGTLAGFPGAQMLSAPIGNSEDAGASGLIGQPPPAPQDPAAEAKLKRLQELRTKAAQGTP